MGHLPRLVHFTRPPAERGRGGLPTVVWRLSLWSWRRFFPKQQQEPVGGFEHRVWTDRNLTACMAEEFPEHLVAYAALPGGVERADVGRYCLLHQHGGIYADLDYEARAPFYPDLAIAVEGGAAAVVESPYKELGEEVQNSLMASPAGHPLWRALMHAIFSEPGPHRWSNERGGTGPRMLSRLLAETSEDQRGRVVLLPCELYQRAVEPNAGPPRCGHITDGTTAASLQRGVHWGSMSHAAFKGLPLRAEFFFGLHPELAGRPLAASQALLETAEAAAAAASATSGALAILTDCAADADGAGGRCREERPEALDLAAGLLREAAGLAPGVASTRYLLGTALELQARPAEALESYRAALRLDPALEAARLAEGQLADLLASHPALAAAAGLGAEVVEAAAAAAAAEP